MMQKKNRYRLLILSLLTSAFVGCLRQEASQTQGIIDRDDSTPLDQAPDWLLTLKEGRSGEYCTAFAATPWQIVTAAHCVYQKNLSDIRIAPSQGKEFGVKSVRYKKGYDIAIIEPSEPYLYATTLDYASSDPGPLDRFSVVWKSASRTKWSLSNVGSVQKTADERIVFHSLDTLPGASGAPIVSQNKDGRLRIFALHVGFQSDAKQNVGVKLDSHFLNDLTSDGKPLIALSYQPEEQKVSCFVNIGRSVQGAMMRLVVPCTPEATRNPNPRPVGGGNNPDRIDPESPWEPVLEPVTEDGPVDPPGGGEPSGTPGEPSTGGGNSDSPADWPFEPFPFDPSNNPSNGGSHEAESVLGDGIGTGEGCFGCAVSNSDLGTSMEETPEVDCKGADVQKGAFLASGEGINPSKERKKELNESIQGKTTLAQKAEFDKQKTKAKGSIAANSGTSDSKPKQKGQETQTGAASGKRSGQGQGRTQESPISRIGGNFGDLGLAVGQAAEKFVGYLKGELDKLALSLGSLPPSADKQKKERAAAIVRSSIKRAEENYKEGRYAEGNEKVRLAIKGLGIATHNSDTLDNDNLIWPFKDGKGVVTSKVNPARVHPVLGTTRPHNGTDFGMPAGSAIQSVSNGVVVRSYSHKQFGNSVVVAANIAGKNVLIKYAHLTKRNVASGDTVKSGDDIGTLGSTGSMCDGPHLHLEIREVEDFETWEAYEFSGPVLDPEELIQE